MYITLNGFYTIVQCSTKLSSIFITDSQSQQNFEVMITFVDLTNSQHIIVVLFKIIQFVPQDGHEFKMAKTLSLSKIVFCMFERNSGSKVLSYSSYITASQTYYQLNMLLKID